MRIFKDSPKFTAGVIMILLLVIIAFLEPTINNYRLNGHSSTEIGLYDPSLPYSRKHPLGTDAYGRDIFSLILTGLRYSLLIGFIAGSLATIIAVVLATIAGYKGGRIDFFVSAISNAMLIIPSWPILAIIVLFVRKINLFLMSLILAFFSWSGSCRQIKPQISSLKERPYVDLARVTGLSDIEIMFKEILPNFLPYIFVGFSYAVTGTMMAETALRLVGLGPADIPSLGQILNWALYTGALTAGHYFLVLTPIVILILIFVSINLINVGLDEVYNPRLKQIIGV